MIHYFINIMDKGESTLSKILKVDLKKYNNHIEYLAITTTKSNLVGFFLFISFVCI